MEPQTPPPSRSSRKVWDNSPLGCFLHEYRNADPSFDASRCRRVWEEMEPGDREPWFDYSRKLRANGELPPGAAAYQSGPFAQQQKLRSGVSRDVPSPGTPAVSHASGIARRGGVHEPSTSFTSRDQEGSSSSSETENSEASSKEATDEEPRHEEDEGRLIFLLCE